MAKKSLTIQNRNGDELYPVTVSSLVYDNADGITVKTKLDTLQTSKQDLLVSGTNIKTINNSSILGNGNIEIIGEKGDDGLDAYQPFKGWYTTSTALSNAFSSPKVGDFAYVKGSTSADPVAIYECVTAGTWSNSGREFNPANNQEFASGQALNVTNIVDNVVTNSSTDVLSARQGMVLKSSFDLLSQQVSGINARFNTTVARLLADVLRKIAYIDTSIQDDASQLIAILDAQASVVSISATYIGGQKYTGDTISVSDFAVVATYDDNTSGSVTATSISPTRLTSTSTQVTVTYNGKTTVVTVSATFNAVVSISDISTTQTDAVEGEPVDLSAITYTLHYANGNSVEMNDPNIITATPSTLNSGTNNITIALADDSTISGTLTINAGGAVTSATVLYPWASGETAGNSVEVLTRTIPTPLTAMPRYINITSVSAGGSATAYLIIDGEFQYDSTTNKWSGYVHRQSTTQKTFSDANISFEQDERGRYAEISIGPLAFDSTHNLVFRKDRRSYTITISDTIPTT